MATTWLMPLHAGKGRRVGTAITDILDYVMNPQKTDNGRLITGFQCDSRVADEEFLFSKQQYTVLTGRTRGKDDVIAYHLRQSFVPGEITPEEANRIGCELAKRFTKNNHAFIVCTHIDKEHTHNHIIWNSTALDCSRKFRNFWGSAMAVRRLSDTLCIENGLSIVEKPNQHGKKYNKWLGDRKKLSQRDELRAIIDKALEQKPANFDALLTLLQEAGCVVKRGGKVPSLKAPGWKAAARMDTLGANYDVDVLRAILSGQKVHTPRKNYVQPAAENKFDLLVDIQAKLRAGKGAGYERWAKSFNLKQMAQTVNFLSENGLLDYGALKERIETITDRRNALSAQIKDAEKRLAEIAVLKTHIIHYVKTREVYAAYRRTGYAKKFLAEHEADILLHKAAKKAFDELGVTKLPTVKSLQSEYATILAGKKADYESYRAARDEMRKLLIAKANIDRLLGHDDEKQKQRQEEPRE